MPRLLCFTAHPDDEASSFGGALHRYAARGVETCVICLTPGQAGTHRGDAQTGEALSAARRKEFAGACGLLHVARGEVLDYPDGKLDHQDVYFVVSDLARRVREIRPDVIMTFGPEGAFTAHPDHSMVSIFSTLAFHWAGRSNRFPEQLENGLAPHQTQKLYYTTGLFTLSDRQPVALPPASAVLELDRRELDAKIQAFRCHTSQQPLFAYFESIMSRHGRLEAYHLAAASTPRKSETETDLFAGVTEIG